MDNKSDVEKIYDINDKLIKIVNKELEKEEVPSKEVLDTIRTILCITAATPKPME